MKLISILSILCIINTFCFSQQNEIKYYKDINLQIEVPKKKASYVLTTTYDKDGIVTYKCFDLDKKELVYIESYKGDEPYGVWKIGMGNNIVQKFDYNFPLIYFDSTSTDCKEKKNVVIGNFFVDQPSIGYTAPILQTGERDVHEYLLKNLIIPDFVFKRNLQGNLKIKYDISADGNIENIVVLNKTNPILDKEIVRIFRHIRFSSPPKLNGTPIPIYCIINPVNVKIHNN